MWNMPMIAYSNRDSKPSLSPLRCKFLTREYLPNMACHPAPRRAWPAAQREGFNEFLPWCWTFHDISSLVKLEKCKCGANWKKKRESISIYWSLLSTCHSAHKWNRLKHAIKGTVATAMMPRWYNLSCFIQYHSTLTLFSASHLPINQPPNQKFW